MTRADTVGIMTCILMRANVSLSQSEAVQLARSILRQAEDAERFDARGRLAASGEPG